MITKTLIDIHAHPFLMPEVTSGGLLAFSSFLDRAKAAQVEMVVGAAVNQASGEQLLHWAREFPQFKVALGWHPWYLDDIPADFINILREQFLAAAGTVVAIGEIGLDGGIERSLDEQMEPFIAQLDLARELQTVAIIHARKATQKVVDILMSRSPQPVVLHSFSGSFPQVEPLLRRGQTWISFSGSLTRPRAKKMRQLAAQLPDGVILLETDSPSIGIQGVAAGGSEPAYLPLIAAQLAQIRDLTVEEVAEITTTNTKKLFGV